MYIFQFKAPIDVSSPTIPNTIQQHFLAAKLREVSAMDHSTGRSLISLETKPRVNRPYFPIESWLINRDPGSLAYEINPI